MTQRDELAAADRDRLMQQHRGQLQAHQQSWSQLFLCPICLCTIDEPFTLRCRHTFCYRCISNHVRHNTNAASSCKCPLCKSVMNTQLGKNYTPYFPVSALDQLKPMQTQTE